jgi:hypothetical protein
MLPQETKKTVKTHIDRARSRRYIERAGRDLRFGA